MKKLQNNFTTPEQSKLLLELRVPADSADCYHNSNCNNRAFQLDNIFSQCEWITDKPTPCWSVGRLMEIIDICETNPRDEEYPTTKMVKDETKMDYIDYLVGTVKMMLPRLDFSKLEE